MIVTCGKDAMRIVCSVLGINDLTSGSRDTIARYIMQNP